MVWLRRPRSTAASGRPSASSNSGQALVELALVAPVILLLLLTAIDLSRIYFAKLSVAGAAREAAYEASIDPTSYRHGEACSTLNRVVCAATNASGGGGIDIQPSDISLACWPTCAATFGAEVTATVTGHFTVLTPLMWAFTGGSDVTFSATASADVVVVSSHGGSGPPPSPPPLPTPLPVPTLPPLPTPEPLPTPTPVPSTSGCQVPIASFATSQASKQAPVLFTSTSIPTSPPACAIQFWRWNFGDGTGTDAGNFPTTSHNYGNQARGDTFLVTLIVTNPAGSTSVTQAVTTLQ